MNFNLTSLWDNTVKCNLPMNNDDKELGQLFEKYEINRCMTGLVKIDRVPVTVSDSQPDMDQASDLRPDI